MKESLDLIQVSLPDSRSIITASISPGPNKTPNAAHLIYLLLSDAANTASLYSVFGSNYDPSATLPDSKDSGSWWIDTNGMPWAIQTVEISEPNRQWQPEELDGIGDGLLSLSTSIFDYLLETGSASHRPFQDSSSSPKRSTSGYSDFALSSHLHTPRLRLVCGAPGLAVRLRFAHVPEITDGWEGRVHFLPCAWDGIGPASGSGTTAFEIIEAICEEFGIRRVVLQGSKSAKVEYALADVISEHITMPPPPPLNSQVSLPEHLMTLPGPPEAYPRLYFTISANWLSRLGTVALGFSKYARKNKSRLPSADLTKETREVERVAHLQSPKASSMLSLWAVASSVSRATGLDLSRPASASKDPVESSESSIDDAEPTKTSVSSADEEEATVKDVHQTKGKSRSTSNPSNARLSKMFEGWLSASGGEGESQEVASTSPTSRHSRSSKVLNVSSPMPSSSSSLDIESVSSSVTTPSDWSSVQVEAEDNLEMEFEQLMMEMGMKGNSREAMLALSDDRKRYLISQNEAAKTAASKSKTLSPQSTGVSSLAGEKVGNTLSDTLNRASVALTWGHRFSIASITGWAGEDGPTSNSTPRDDTASYPSSRITSTAHSDDCADAIKVQSTGASTSSTLWTSWWGNSSTDAVEKDDPAYYPRLLLNGKQARKDLLKSLISLRVTLSSAKLIWISAFLEERGLTALEKILATETRPYISSSHHLEAKELSSVILSETVKCLRTLMNTEPGFSCVLQQPHLVNCITYALCAPSYKLQSQVADLLAALCVLSSHQGHKMVCSGLSELCIITSQRYRFALLVDSLSVEVDQNEHQDRDESFIWEYRTSTLVLINALANGPEDLEERISLRDEFTRRGLNEVMVALGYMDPPDSILTQIQVYNEERQDDLDELHDRVKAANVDLGNRFGKVQEIYERIDSEHTKQVMDVFQNVAHIANRDVDYTLRSDILHLVETFINHCAELNNFDEDWNQSSRLFLASVEHIIGKQVMIKANRLSDTSTIPSSFLKELEELRSKVENLSDEKRQLKLEVSEKLAQLNTLRGLPGANAILNVEISPKDDNIDESYGGVIQQLIQKEKQVLDLQRDLERMSGGNGIASTEEEETRAKRERLEKNRQWTNLMEEIATIKEQLAESRAVVDSRDKEIRYLKRALEAVYSRFQNGIAPAGLAVIVSSDQQDAKVVKKQTDQHSIDAETIANKTIEALGQKEAEIANLRSDVAKLQDEMIRADERQQSKQADLEAFQNAARDASEAIIAALRQDITRLQKEVDSLTMQATEKGTSRSPASLAISAPPLPPPPPPPPPPAPPTTMTTIPAPSSQPPPPHPPPPPPMAPLVAPFKSSAPPTLADQCDSMGMPPPPPPPPPGAPLPPPAPTLGPVFSPLQVTASESKIPEKRRKPLFWNKLPVQVVVKTVWNDLPTDKVDVRLADFDKLFAIQNNVEGKKSVAEEQKKKKKNTLTTLIELQRSQNIAIMLSRIKLPFSQIRTCLLEMDLSLDHLKVIRNCLPNQEEAELIREHQGDFATLGKADQFFKEILGIPKVKERVECMIYMKKFEMELEELKPDLKMIREAVNEVNQSVKFKFILKSVLMMGNVLNNKTFRGEARGFILNDLLKLRETRAAIASSHQGILVTPTLLHYLVQILNRQDSSLVGFLDDCEHVEAAARINTVNLAASVTAMVNGLERLQEEVITLKKMRILSSSDQFILTSERFIKQAQSQMAILQRVSKEVFQDGKKMLEYFGEMDKNAKIEDLFSLIGSFGQSLMRAELEVKANEARLEEKEQSKMIATSIKSTPVLEIDTPASLVVSTTMLAFLREGCINKEGDEQENIKQSSTLTRCNNGGIIGKGSIRGSSIRFQSWGQNVEETLPEDALLDGQQSTLGKTNAVRIAGGRGQLDEALKELRINGTARKSLKRQNTQRHRPLSRVFLDT